MTIQDNFLQNAASLLETNNDIDYAGYSNSDGTNTTDGSLNNEIGTRPPATVSRDATTIIYNATRSSTDVVDTTNGDDIEEIGLFKTSSGSDLQLYTDVANINHTTDFDIETTHKVTLERR